MKAKTISNTQDSARVSMGQRPKHLLTKKQQANKENLIQITEPLQPLNHLSKQFILSKDLTNFQNYDGLKDSSQCIHISNSKNSKQNILGLREELGFDRRLSLKCTKNENNDQISQRMSMIPMKRDSISTFTTCSISHPEERESILSLRNTSHHESMKSIRTSTNKDAIINNLMSKLDHEEDLKTIISNKLTKKDTTQIHFHDSSQETAKMALKLKQCQNQVRYFKALIKEMTQKMAISNEKSQMSNTECHCSHLNESTHYTPKMMKKTKSIGVQTKSQNKQVNPFEEKGPTFMDNLQKTLKMLDFNR